MPRLWRPRVVGVHGHFMSFQRSRLALVDVWRGVLHGCLACLGSGVGTEASRIAAADPATRSQEACDTVRTGYYIHL